MRERERERERKGERGRKGKTAMTSNGKQAEVRNVNVHMSFLD